MLWTLCIAGQAFSQEASISVRITPPVFDSISAPGNQTQSGTITTTAIVNPTLHLAYYYLLTSATLGSVSPGTRKLYKDGNVTSASIPVAICTSPIVGIETEIGTVNLAGNVVLSGFMTGIVASNLTFYTQVSIPVGTLDGVYSNTFSFSLYLNSTAAGSGTLTVPSKGALTFTITATIIEGSVSLSLSPASISFNKGNPVTQLTPLSDLVEKAAVNITATRGYTLTVSSSHAGYLWLSDKDTIQYVLKVEGVSIDLSSGKEVLIVDNASPGTVSYTLEFSIISLAESRPGNYSDNLTFIATVR